MNILEFDEHTSAHKAASQKVVRDYLTSNGWKYTSRHPGSIWLWTFEKATFERDPESEEIVRTLVETYAVQESVALQIQRYWELEKQNFNTHADDCPIFESFDWADCNCMTKDDLAPLDGDVDDRLPAQP